MTTLTADRGDTWYCSCENHSGREGFAPSDEDGDERALWEGVPWRGHYRCNRCLFVFTESDLIREA